MMLGIAFALFAGILLFGSRVVNFRLSQSLGSAGGSFANHWVGTLAGALLILATQVPFLASTEPISWVAWMGGPIGAFFVIICNLTMGEVSVMISTTLIFIGQVAMSILLDFQLTGHPISPKQLLGGAFIFIGILWNQKANEAQKSQRSA